MLRNENRPVGQVIMGIIIFYQIIMNSAWITIDTNPWWKIAGYLLYAVLLAYIAVEAWTFRFSPAQFFSELLMLGFLGIYMLLGNLTVVIVFLFAMAASFFPLRELIDVYLYGMSAGFLTVFVASLLGALPMLQLEKGFWVFGFKNPNVTGFYLIVILLLLLVKYWNRVGLKLLFFAFLISVFCAVYLEDWTALLTLIAALLMWLIDRIWPKFAYLKVNQILLKLTPFLLTALSLFIAWGWSHLEAVRKLNRVFTARPDIWNHYVTTSSPRLFGSSLPDQLTYADGAFDGAYIYYPIANGIVLTLLVLIALCVALHFMLKERQTPYIVLILALLIFAFSENPSFFAFQSPLLPMALVLGLPGFNRRVDIPALSNVDETEVVS